MSSYTYLTIETRTADATPREVLLAFAAASHREATLFGPGASVSTDRWVRDAEPTVDVAATFPWAFVWAGNLHVGLPDGYRELRLDPDPTSTPRNFADYLVPVVQTYEGVNRAVFGYFYDTPMNGRMAVYDRTAGGPRVVESFQWGLDYGWWGEAKNAGFGDGDPVPTNGWVTGPVDYVQGRYGLHTITHREIRDHSRLVGLDEIVPLHE